MSDPAREHVTEALTAEAPWVAIADQALSGDWESLLDDLPDQASELLQSEGAAEEDLGPFLKALVAVIGHFRAAIERERAQAARPNSVTFLLWRTLPTVLASRGEAWYRPYYVSAVGRAMATLYERALASQMRRDVFGGDVGGVCAAMTAWCRINRAGFWYFHDRSDLRDQFCAGLEAAGLERFVPAVGTEDPWPGAWWAGSVRWDVTGEAPKWRYAVVVDLTRLPAGILALARRAGEEFGITAEQASEMLARDLHRSDIDAPPGGYTREMVESRMALAASLGPEFANQAYPELGSPATRTFTARPADVTVPPVVADLVPSVRLVAPSPSAREVPKVEAEILTGEERSVVSAMRLARAARRGERARRIGESWADLGASDDLGVPAAEAEADPTLRLQARQIVYRLRKPELWGAALSGRLRRFQTEIDELRETGRYGNDDRVYLQRIGGIVGGMPPVGPAYHLPSETTAPASPAVEVAPSAPSREVVAVRPTADGGLVAMRPDAAPGDEPAVLDVAPLAPSAPSDSSAPSAPLAPSAPSDSSAPSAPGGAVDYGPILRREDPPVALWALAAFLLGRATR